MVILGPKMSALTPCYSDAATNGVFGRAYLFSYELYDDAQHCSQKHKHQDAEYVTQHDFRFLLTWLRTRTVKSFS